MTSPARLGAVEIAAGLAGATDAILGAREKLCELDAIAGDGDLGVTLATGFTAIRALLEQIDEKDVGALLVHAARELGRKAPSTLGTLLSLALVKSGEGARGKEALDSFDFASLLESTADEIRRRGRVEAGQRTVFNAVSASAHAARAAATAGADLDAVIAHAVDAAAAGAAATATMEPTVGRAGWLAERARGHPDAGAIAWVTILAGFAGGVRRAREAQPTGKSE